MDRESEKETRKRIVPVIQAFSEFKESLNQGKKEVMIFFWEAMEKEKKEAR